MNKWISVKDSLPNNQQSVIATNGKEVAQCKLINRKLFDTIENKWFIGCFYGDCGGLRSSEPYSYDKYIENVTHWMTLPQLPKENTHE